MLKITLKTDTEQRKAAIYTIAELTQTDVSYCGAPTFSYEAGAWRIDKNGALTRELTEDCFEELQQVLDAVEIKTQINFEFSGTEMPCMHRLRNLLQAKGTLIRHALQSEIRVAASETEPILTLKLDALPQDRTVAAGLFFWKLCAFAETLRYVTATEKPTENEKYTFRCFLMRIGFVGTAYKKSRKILLQHLSGNSAFKSNRREVSQDETNR